MKLEIIKYVPEKFTEMILQKLHEVKLHEEVIEALYNYFSWPGTKKEYV